VVEEREDTEAAARLLVAVGDRCEPIMAKRIEGVSSDN